MKKFFALLLVLCLAFAGLISYIAYVPMPIANEVALESAPAYEGETAGEVPAAEEAAAPSYRGLDYEAILALHNDEEIVGSVNGRDVTWREYFYWFYMQANQIDSMAITYGIDPDWSEMATEDMNLSQIVLENAAYMIRQMDAIELYASENGVALTDEDMELIAQQIESEKTQLMGEGATDEAFNAKLKELHMSREMYEKVIAVNALIERGFTELYGENGEKADEADVIKYLEDNEYMSAHHILIMSIDPATGMKLDDAAIEESRAQAEALADELQAIESDEERLARFNELKAELCDDTGKVAYPDGYTYTPGTMYPEFEAACLAQEAYQVSDVVETGVGFHVIMTLPLDADATVFSADGSPSIARVLYAEADYNEALAEKIDSVNFEYAESFEEFYLGDFENVK